MAQDTFTVKSFSKREPFLPRADDAVTDYLQPVVENFVPVRELSTMTRRAYVAPEIMAVRN